MMILVYSLPESYGLEHSDLSTPRYWRQGLFVLNALPQVRIFEGVVQIPKNWEIIS